MRLLSNGPDMKPLLILLAHIGALFAVLFALLIALMIFTGPGIRAGERAVLGFLLSAPLLWVVACVSLHRRLPAEMGIAAKLGMDGAFLLGGGFVIAMLGLTSLVVFNR